MNCTRTRVWRLATLAAVSAITLGGGTALAAPFLIYSSWLGDPARDPQSPDGAYFQWCDFGTVVDPSVKNCVPNDRFDSPTGPWDVTTIPGPTGGVGTVDLDNDGRLDLLALTQDDFTQHASAATIAFNPGRLTIHVETRLAIAAHGVGLGDRTNDVGFTVTGGAVPPKILLAHTTGADLVVDVRTLTGAFDDPAHPSRTLVVPGMNTVSRAAGADFLGFTAGVRRVDGVPEMMVLHTGPAGSNTAIVSVFEMDGRATEHIPLNLDPVAAARAASGGLYDETLVGGFGYMPIVSGGPNEFVVLTVDHNIPVTGDGRFGPDLKFTLFRFSETGSLIGSVNMLDVPNYRGAVPIGIAALDGDTDCDGIDDDGDGTPDNHYIPKTVSCGFGACAQTTSSTCSNGVETPAPACVAPSVSTEVLNGLDDDCDGKIDDIPAMACAPGQTDWWCCPQGQLHFAVNAVTSAATPNVDQQAAEAAAATCFPTSSGLASTCNLRAVVTRAIQLRDEPGVRSQCSVVAELAPGLHELRLDQLYLSAGDLTLQGMGANQADVTVRPSDATPSRILSAGPFLGATVALTVKNLTMSNGRAFNGGAISFIGPDAVTREQPRAAKLTILDSTFANNTTDNPGGAIFVQSAAVEVHDSVFRGNSVANYADGGGVTSRGGGLFLSNSEAVIDHSAFVGNAASKGGGVGAYATPPLLRGKVAITNSTMSRNFCGHSGCGFDSFGAEVTLAFDTIADNRMVTDSPVTQNRFGPGLNIERPMSGDAPRVNIFGSIIAHNQGDFKTSGKPGDGLSWDCRVDLDPSATSIGASDNLIGSGGEDCALLGNPASDPLIGEGRPQGGSNPADPVVDPQLRSLQETQRNCSASPSWLCQSVCDSTIGAATCVQTMMADSPVVGKGLAATCPADDQIRYSRPAGLPCTLGAYEYNGVPSAAAQAAMAVLPRGGMMATSSSANGGDPAANAIDGNAGTRFSTGTPQTPGQWLSLDMQTQRTFSQVTLDPGVASPNDYARQYQVYVSNDAVTWLGPVASGTGAPGVLSIAFPTQTARFVGVVQTGSSSSWWSVAELNVYGPGGVPVAPLPSTGWLASASQTNGSEVPSRALDGNTATRWSTGVPQANGQTFQLDMLQPRTIAGLTMNSDTSSPNDYPRSFTVFATNDTAAWGTPVATGTGGAAVVNVSFPQTTARYLKIVLGSSTSSWWSIAELTVYGLGTFAPAPTALPRSGWIGTASPSCGSGDTPDRALDDQASTRFSTCQNQAAGQYYQVDMLTARSFSRVTLDAGSSVGDYARGYAVYATNNPSSWGAAIATGTGTGQLISITFPNQTARYLKIVQTGSAAKWWSIHELNVYGVAPALLPRRAWTATASQSAGTAGAGIDSNASTRWTTGVPQANGQYYQVDLGAPQAFNLLTLNSDGASSDYPRAYQVFATNDPASLGAAIASGVASSSLVSIGFPVQRARYVRVVQTGSSSSWWSLAELNLWAPGPSP